MQFKTFWHLNLTRFKATLTVSFNHLNIFKKKKCKNFDYFINPSLFLHENLLKIGCYNRYLYTMCDVWKVYYCSTVDKNLSRLF